MSVYAVTSLHSSSSVHGRIAVVGVIGLAFLADCRAPMHMKFTDAGPAEADGDAGPRDLSPAVDARVGPEASTCDELATEAETQFQTYLDRNSAQACEMDSDCTLWQEKSLGCFAACGLLVGPDAASGPVGTAARRICDSYFGAGCPEIRRSCVATSIVCERGRCTYALPGRADPQPDAPPSESADAALDSAAVMDMQPACSVPSEGAPCTPDQVPCATCCTDHWSCGDGTWRNLWLGCLPTTFACGDQTCAEASEYCETDLHFGGLPLPTTYAC